jgi:hypothetical protein
MAREPTFGGEIARRHLKARRGGGRSLSAILDKLDLIRATGVPGLPLPEAFRPRLGQMAREV